MQFPPIPSENKLVSVAQMQEIERLADASGHSYAAMMEMAGRAVADAIIARWGEPALRVLILVGPGNNGGDGLVCARHLHEAGIDVHVYLWKRRTDPEYDYEHHFAKLTELGVASAHADSDAGLTQLHAWLDEATIIVDSLLGTGVNRSIGGELADILNAVTAQPQRPTIVAVDSPSGLNCDTGALDPHALAGDLTVTFANAKIGHYKFPGAMVIGELLVVDIGTSSALVADVTTFALAVNVVRPWLPRRAVDSHKGTYGKVMAAVGCVNYPGAAYLSCAAAGRAGAGLITGAVAEPVWGLVAGKLTEPTWLPLPATDAGMIDGAGAHKVADALPGYNALILGCGLGHSDATRQFVADLLVHELPPTLIDADGLNNLANLPDWPQRLPAQTVLTPHPAEMSRLCALRREEVVANRWSLAVEKAAAWQAVVLLKGPYTVIAAPDGRLAVLPIATPALATAGTGDVLAGAIGGLLAQGVPPFEAASLGSWLHGRAGLRCEAEIGRAGVVASDLLPRLPVVIRSLCGA